MKRTVLIQFLTMPFPGTEAKKTNLNDEIGLDPYIDYTLEQHIEDLASEGISLVSVIGRIHLFSDGSTRAYEEVEEEIPLGQLDVATYFLLCEELFTNAGPPKVRRF